MKLNIIPQPQKVELTATENVINGIFTIEIEDGFDSRIGKFAETLKSETGRKLSISRDTNFERNNEYRIDFSENAINLSARTDVGAYYGLQTISQIQKKRGLKVIGTIHDWADIEMRIQHVDLKRIGWNFDYILELVDLFACLKINYILLEYEDKFKFDFCDDIPVKSAFTKDQIAELERKAYNNFIQIIPLVQCIGHFEYILKHDKYLDICENPEVRTQACPLKPATLKLFKKMASEVMEMHPSSEFFHIGADEPFLLGTCPKCAAEAEKNGEGKLYIDFLNKILSWIIDEKGKVPLFWADILERYNDAADICRKDSIAVEWNYQPLSLRDKSIKFYQSSTGKIDKDIYENELTQEQHARFDKYLKYDPQKEDFSSLPFGAYLKDLGFKVISASNVKFVDNVKTHSEAVKEDGLLGNLATFWASANSNRPPNTLFETRLQGVCMLAASAWNLEYENNHHNSFYERTSNYLNDNEKYSIIYEIFNTSGHIISPNDNNRNDETYFHWISQAVENFSDIKDNHLSLLMDFIRKISIEKKLDSFKKEKLSIPLLSESFYHKIDIEPYCNERFSNTEEIPGWSRIYQNDLRFFPKGDVCFNGVPFHVNPDKPDGRCKSTIMIGDYPEKPFYPKSINGINVGKKASSVNFIHGHIEGHALSNGYYGKYILNYTDGDNEEIPLFYNKNIGAWWKIVEIEDASIAWAGENLKNANVGLYIYTYFPNHSDKIIESVDFICESQAVLALAAITVVNNETSDEIPNSPIRKEILTFTGELSLLRSRMRKDLKYYLSDDGMDEVIRIAFDFTGKYLDRLKKSMALV